MKDLTVEIYADGASLDEMKADLKNPQITGFTTNPSLVRQAGVTNYLDFAREVLEEITEHPVSFEVFSDDLEEMEQEALKLASLGENVFVKIPVMNTKGESTKDVIKKLAAQGVKLNVTAIFTVDQVREVVDHLEAGVDSIVSVFAGRIADTGVDPLPVMEESLKICQEKEGCKLLWASTRETYNIYEADRLGVDIITSPSKLIQKLEIGGKDLVEYSRDTVKGFMKDIKAANYTILD